MNVLAKYNQVRSSAQKIRLIANIIRGKKALLALQILSSVKKKAALLVKKLLKSALSNAEHNYGYNKEVLIISKIFVNSGSSMKRMMPRAKGRADRILKRTSHITVILSDIKKNPEGYNGSKSTP
ncbi:50S ribosomal protein L22 [Buchnera aphidicola]|uniref:Large ribosomal subunit protein uL22 n=2 Tax=Buchnera aphidicola (Cinara cedri) TaxID=261318 RepID=RL22_BUCCC|nr:50S ribosomal protein L22 [Buchnera aphidicola]Q057A9.1 RecName: Full=Large ribosomal subunit protein uL22; AltName: Full=50S ribosomal protein L22 [Buchnera aphidicola BCc]AAW72702.1 50S ribosomal protein L22 [Buchnera aphidicola (Cinara cedri)]ABJ90790.1 50S ribosomal protein L22 [Buchnera aphidicola BCc]